MKTGVYIILTVISLTIVGCQQDSKRVGYRSDGSAELNLTENALWDKPAMKETQRDSFYNMMSREYDPKIVRAIEKMREGSMPLKNIQHIYDTLATSKSVYAGFVRLYALNRILIQMPIEKFTKDFVKKCLRDGYHIAKGKAPVSQALFFNFWDNCMVGFANANAYDDVSKEAQLLLEMCEDQNLPVGVMFAYRALAGNLRDHYDFSTAMMEYSHAEKAAMKSLPKLLGNDWLSVKNMDRTLSMSDLMTCYVDMKSEQLYCCVRSRNYDWITKNEKSLKQVIEGTKNQPTEHSFMLYNMAQYYDAIGKDSLFSKYIKEVEQYAPKPNGGNDTYSDMMYDYCYNLTMGIHELRQSNLTKALEYMDRVPKEWMTVETEEIYSEIYMRLGRYQEASKHLSSIVEHNKEDLDGRNRQTLNSMSENIENKKRDMQLMQTELDKQRMQNLYNTVILVFAFIFIAVLAYFLYRQNKLNRRLEVALDKAEAANKAKSLFLKNMTHEIHTPINQIYGFAQIMADRSMPLDEESTRMMCDAICESSEHLTKLADNIIEVADKVSDLDGLEQGESVLKV